MTIAPTINLSTPFLVGVPNSQVSQEWLRFLSQIVTLVLGGSGTTTADDVQTLFMTGFYRPEKSEIDQLKVRIKKLENALAIERSKHEKKPKQETLKHKTASESHSVSINDDNASINDMYPVFVSGFGGSKRQKISSTNLKFNPSTGKLTSYQVVATTGFGCNGATAQTSYALGSAATDLASVITLANNLRTMAINNGMGS